jgi:hypothetical protein
MGDHACGVASNETPIYILPLDRIQRMCHSCIVSLRSYEGLGFRVVLERASSHSPCPAQRTWSGDPFMLL